MAATDSRTYASLVDELVSERVTGRRRELPTTPAMQWGIDHEPVARTWYSRQTGNHVEQVGFVPHRSLGFVGVSPDGLVGARGVLEIKCPQPKAYLETTARGRVPARYIWQVQGEIWVCEREFADFVCFHPSMGGLVIRVQRDEARIAKLQARCEQIEREVQRRIAGNTPRRKSTPAPSNAWPRQSVSSEPGEPAQLKRNRLSDVPWWVWAIAAAVVWYWLVH
jgi:hypothetical protein